MVGPVALVVLAAVVTWLVHRETLHYGFEYDDYYFLRPHTLAEVLATFHGPWDVGGVMVKFYRPLTVVLHAIRFELFGLNAPAHHAVSLTLFAVAASLVGWLAYRLTGRAIAAVRRDGAGCRPSDHAVLARRLGHQSDAPAADARGALRLRVVAPRPGADARLVAAAPRLRHRGVHGQGRRPDAAARDPCRPCDYPPRVRASPAAGAVALRRHGGRARRRAPRLAVKRARRTRWLRPADIPRRLDQLHARG